jgi:hypothetical protein
MRCSANAAPGEDSILDTCRHNSDLAMASHQTQTNAGPPITLGSPDLVEVPTAEGKFIVRRQEVSITNPSSSIQRPVHRQLGLTSDIGPSGPSRLSSSALGQNVFATTIRIRFGSTSVVNIPSPLVDFRTSSDGPQPHYITIEFPRKVAIQVRGRRQSPD